MAEDIIKPIEDMTNDELIATVTVNKDNYNEEYREEVRTELNNRGVKLEDLLKVAEYGISSGEFEKVDISLACEKLSLLKDRFGVIYFKNYMGGIMAVQKNPGAYVFHHYYPASGFTSFFLSNEELVKSSLTEFLSLGNWLPEGVEATEHWDTFAESSSIAYINRLAAMLDNIGINYSLNSNKLFRFASVSAPYGIILPVECMEEAEEVMDKINDLKEELHKELAAAEEEGNVDRQLEILIKLESVSPDDSAVFYNKAELLDQKGDYQNASEALIESFNLDFSEGIVDDLEDTEEYLKEMLDKVENKKSILHCLATIAAYKGEAEDSLVYYTRLVDLDENDAIAHLNLGHHYYSNTEDDEKIKFHYKKYLELEHEGSEREAVETILENLC